MAQPRRNLLVALAGIATAAAVGSFWLPELAPQPVPNQSQGDPAWQEAQRIMRLVEEANALPYTGPDKVAGMPGAELARANRGRSVIGPDGRFDLPTGVRRAWIDVGAHLLEVTKGALNRPDLAVIGVEPLMERVVAWPAHERLIAIPFALFSEEGTMVFHVNAFAMTSSLLATAKDHAEGDPRMKTVIERPVPVIRLERILAAVPDDVCIEFVKTDVQGVDLQVLQSAGELLRRVRVIHTEVIFDPMYEAKKGGTAAMSGSEEFEAYLGKLGFRRTHTFDTYVRKLADGGSAPGWTNMEFIQDGWSCASSPPREIDAVRADSEHCDLFESCRAYREKLSAGSP